MRYLILVSLIIGSLLASCSYKQNQILFEQKRAMADTVAPKNSANIVNYRIQPQDILQIRNVQNDKSIIDLTAATPSAGAATPNGRTEVNYMVEDDGTIALAGLGRVKVSGLTRGEATAHLEQLYGQQYLKNPILEVKIVNLKVTILGEVSGQGNYLLTKDNTSLIQLIGEAGGLTPAADERTVKIIRGDKAKPDIIMVDLSDIRSLANPNTVLRNDDVVYISKNKRAIRSDKVNTFTTIIQPALIILNTALIILTLSRR